MESERKVLTDGERVNPYTLALHLHVLADLNNSDTFNLKYFAKKKEEILYLCKINGMPTSTSW